MCFENRSLEDRKILARHPLTHALTLASTRSTRHVIFLLVCLFVFLLFFVSRRRTKVYEHLGLGTIIVTLLAAFLGGLEMITENSKSFSLVLRSRDSSSKTKAPWARASFRPDSWCHTAPPVEQILLEEGIGGDGVVFWRPLRRICLIRAGTESSCAVWTVSRDAFELPAVLACPAGSFFFSSVGELEASDCAFWCMCVLISLARICIWNTKNKDLIIKVTRWLEFFVTHHLLWRIFAKSGYEYWKMLYYIMNVLDDLYYKKNYWPN